MSRLGSDVKRLRNERGMTQKQLAKLLGVSEGFIDDVESGKRVLNGELVSRVFKVLGQDSSKLDFFDADSGERTERVARPAAKVAPKPALQVWNDAFESILKEVPVYDYKMDKAVDARKLPVISNKVEGLPKEKVFYLRIEDNDMTGFRISKDDLALASHVQTIERDGIFFIEHDGKRVVRQVKRLDNNKILLVSNQGRLITETAAPKDIKVLARLIRLEIIL